MEKFDLSYTLALRYLQIRQRSEKEIRDYLKKKKMPENIVSQVVEKLTSQKFLNDALFAKLWVESRNRTKPRSRWLLTRELEQKGIAKEIIDVLFQEKSRTSDLELAKDAIGKRLERVRDASRNDIYQKVGGFLARRGFNWEVSKAAIDDLLKERYNRDK